MRKMVFLFLGLFVSMSASASWIQCTPGVNEWGVVSMDCERKPGNPPDGYYAPGSPGRDGEVSRIERHADGSVAVQRYGREGEGEEWHEISPGEWVRK